MESLKRNERQRRIHPGPEQISDNVDHYWAATTDADAYTVNKEQSQKFILKCKEIVENTVNYLGTLGSKKKFDEEAFNASYKKVDPFGLGKNLKAVVIGLVTTLAACEV